jgi:hypothetical protein
VKALGALFCAFILLLWYVFRARSSAPAFLGDHVVVYISGFLSDAAAGDAAARC